MLMRRGGNKIVLTWQVSSEVKMMRHFMSKWRIVGKCEKWEGVMNSHGK